MNRIKHTFILFVDFIGLLIIVSILLVLLNYFKIIPLSKTFPKYFGFLPQVIQNTAIVSATPKPIVTALVWNKQASQTLVSNYTDYFNKNNNPVIPYQQTTDKFFVIGAFSAYNDNYFQAIISRGPTYFQVASDSAFRKISPPITSKSEGGNGTDRIIATYKNFTEFFNDAPFGSYLEIIYHLKGDIKVANQVDYYPEHKY
jgi:hypothetical protein